MNGYGNSPQLPFTGLGAWELVALVGFAVAAISLGLLLRYKARA
jgi:hypothetical protein